MSPQIWITGQAQLSALGNTPNEFSVNLTAPRSNAKALVFEIPGLGQKQLPVYACDFDLAAIQAPSKLPLDRSSALALGVVMQLLESKQLDIEKIEKSRLGIYWGSGMSGASSLDAATKSLYAEQRRIRPTSVVTSMPNAPAAEISLLLGARGPCLTYATACASSAVAIGEAMIALASGRIDVAIVGGSESMLSPGVLASWDALRVLAQIEKSPQEACRPFDQSRCGFALGEGAAALILETPQHARKLGRSAIASLSGYATNCDGHHMTNPSSQGQMVAMSEALKTANLKPQDIGYINAHGTATAAGDLAEAQSITAVFGAQRVPVSSTKSLHGHLLGGGGAVELMAALHVLNSGIAPHTANLIHPDQRFELDLIQCEPRHIPQLRHVMSNSFAFGGANAVLIASKCTD